MIILDKLVRLYLDCRNHGIAFLFSYFLPVYWTQQTKHQKGRIFYDSVTLKPTGNDYFFGTIYQWKEFVGIR